MESACQPGENITDFGHRVKRLARKAYPSSLLPERVLVDLFVKGLPTDDMKRHVSSLEPRTFAEAMRRATVYEAYTPKTLKKPRPAPVMQVYSTPQQHQNASPTVGPPMPAFPRPPRVARRNDTCYYCGQQGHYRSRCPVRLAKEIESTQTQPDLNSSQLVMGPTYQPTPRGPTHYTSNSQQ